MRRRGPRAHTIAAGRWLQTLAAASRVMRGGGMEEDEDEDVVLGQGGRRGGGGAGARGEEGGGEEEQDGGAAPAASAAVAPPPPAFVFVDALTGCEIALPQHVILHEGRHYDLLWLAFWVRRFGNVDPLRGGHAAGLARKASLTAARRRLASLEGGPFRPASREEAAAIFVAAAAPALDELRARLRDATYSDPALTVEAGALLRHCIAGAARFDFAAAARIATDARAAVLELAEHRPDAGFADPGGHPLEASAAAAALGAVNVAALRAFDGVTRALCAALAEHGLGAAPPSRPALASALADAFAGLPACAAPDAGFAFYPEHASRVSAVVPPPPDPLPPPPQR